MEIKLESRSRSAEMVISTEETKISMDVVDYSSEQGYYINKDLIYSISEVLRDIFFFNNKNDVDLIKELSDRILSGDERKTLMEHLIDENKNMLLEILDDRFSFDEEINDKWNQIKNEI